MGTPHHQSTNPLAAKHHPVHISPLSQYFVVFGALLVLTVATVGVSYADLGPAALLAALVVAFMKAGLVVGYFMHLKYDDRFNVLIFFSTLFFIFLFFTFTLLDYSTRGFADPIEDNRYFRMTQELERRAGAAPAEVGTPAPNRYAPLLAPPADAPAAPPAAAPALEEAPEAEQEEPLDETSPTDDAPESGDHEDGTPEGAGADDSAEGADGSAADQGAVEE